MNKKVRILIAYDGSDGAEAALMDLERAGLPAEAEVIVISVADVVLWPGSNPAAAETSPAMPEIASVTDARQQALQAVEEARSLAVQASQRVRATFPAWKVHAEACGDSPAWAVITKANEWKPDLVVVGSHSRSVLSRLILGSVTQKVVTEASCSVRVGRGRVSQSNQPVRIVIGTDGSRSAEAAVSAVAGRLWPAGAEAKVIAVLEPMMATSPDWIQASSSDQKEWLRKKVVASEERLRASGLIVSSKFQEGDPKRILIDEAEEWEADCIFVGAKGLRGLERFLLGGVSAAVVSRAHCSVEVVRSRQ